MNASRRVSALPILAGILAAIVLLTSPLCRAQSITGGGSIQGTVKDSTGAVVPRAKVTILHVDTGRGTNTESNGEGYFSTPPLSIGKYRVKVEASGMKTWESELLLETGRVSELFPVLAPGQVTETVTVQATVPLVTTTDPTEASTLDSGRIQELPINGRDMNVLLASVTPGVEDLSDDVVQGGTRTGGLPRYVINYLQDGAPANNVETGGAGALQGLESVAEVRVETSTSSAKNNTPTAVIMTTKGGTNKLHGSIYETARNNAFGVARARQDVSYTSTPYQTPKLIRNEFGGSISGPVFLPTFGLNGKKFYNGRNRTFFFFSREALELVQGSSKDFAVATAAMRAGDFSELIDGQGRKITLYDPLTTRAIAANGRQVSSRLPFIDNRIPIQRESPLARFVWGITPLPTDIGNPVVTTNLKMPVPTAGNPNLSDSPATLRIDHRFTDKDNFFIRANHGVRTAGWNGPAAAGTPTAHNEIGMGYVPLQGKSVAVSWTHIFSPGFFVETLANRTWQKTQTVFGATDKNWSQEFGLPNPFNDIGWPNMTNVSFAQYVEGSRRWLRTWTTVFDQNYTAIRGTHNIQFGWRYRADLQDYLPDRGALGGSASFNSLATALESSTSGSSANPTATAQTGYDAANFFLGHAASYAVGLKRGLMRVAEPNYGLYVQDNYKITSRLTITPGVRWDFNPAFTEKFNQLNAFDVASHSIVLPESLDYYYKLGATTPQVVSLYQRVGVKFSSAAELGRPSQVFQSNNFDIGPRFGLVYRLGDGHKQLVVRGGYGMYISALPMRVLLNNFINMPPFIANYTYNPNSAAQSPDGISNYLLRNVPGIVAGVNSKDIIDLRSPNAVGRGVAVIGMGPLPSLKVHEWNVALERQLKTSTVLRVRYNGKHGVNLPQFNNINPTQPDYVWYSSTGTNLPTGEFASVARRPYDQAAYTNVTILEKTGYLNSATYSVELERRFAKGLAFQFFHTVTNTLLTNGNNTTYNAFLPGSVPAEFDALNRLLNYQRDSTTPKHRTRWNWNYELPFGRGKALARNVPAWLNTAIGGWKLSGSGTVVSSWYALPTNNWGEIGKFETYGKKHPILDCRGTPANATRAQDERCIQGYLWFNGYISERLIDSRNAAGLRNGVFGLPTGYQPVEKPVIPWPKSGLTGAPGSADWDTNVAFIPLKNGSVQRVAVDTGLHPLRNQYRLGPFNWTTDASLLKFFSITERARLRVNVDVFNTFNIQGLNPPGADGIASLASSFGGFGFRPRQVQVSMRLEW